MNVYDAHIDTNYICTLRSAKVRKVGEDVKGREEKKSEKREKKAFSEIVLILGCFCVFLLVGRWPVDRQTQIPRSARKRN